MIPSIPQLKHTNSNNFFLIAGPCVVEGEEMLMKTAAELVKLSDELQIPLIFKSSYRKANRSKVDGFTGIGDEAALKLLQQAGKQYHVPVITDIHESHEAAMAAEYVDVLQIPAFLYRQTELLVAAAKTGKPINIKKAQFASADSMQYAAQKVIDAGGKSVMLTDRGNSFGYTDLVVDFRNITIMKRFNYPVIMDCTHSVQQLNQPGGGTGGKPEFIETISRCAIAAGADGLFIETHPNPSVAKSDGTNMVRLADMRELMEKCIRVREAVI